MTRPATRSTWHRQYEAAGTRYALGTMPSPLALEMVASLPPRGRVLELGCGEGRDSVLFASRGFDVVGLDTSAAGLEKAERLASGRGVQVAWRRCALPEVAADGPFDLVYSCGAIHYVSDRDRPALFRRLRRLTPPGGVHAHIVFTDRRVHAEHGEIADYFAPGELRSYFADGTIVRSAHGEIACARDGVAHVHSVELIVARDVARGGGIHEPRRHTHDRDPDDLLREVPGAARDSRLAPAWGLDVHPAGRVRPHRPAVLPRRMAAG